MLHDKATISQSLARGFDLCERLEGGAGGGRAVEPGGRTQLRTPGLGLAASRFSPWLPDPREIQLLEAERGRQTRLSASSECPLGGTNCWPSLVERVYVRKPVAGQRLSDTGR